MDFRFIKIGDTIDFLNFGICEVVSVSIDPDTHESSVMVELSPESGGPSIIVPAKNIKESMDSSTMESIYSQIISLYELPTFVYDDLELSQRVNNIVSNIVSAINAGSYYEAESELNRLNSIGIEGLPETSSMILEQIVPDLKSKIAS